MKTVTRDELVKLIDSEKGSEMVAIHVTTEPTMRKTGNPYVGTVKHQSLSGVIGYDYENSVNNQLVREGKEADFVAQPRSWGVRLDNRWVMHKEERYLTIKVQGAGPATYTLNGTEIEIEKLKPFIPEKKHASTQDDIEKKVIHRDIKLSNVEAITMKGETYRVV